MTRQLRFAFLISYTVVFLVPVAICLFAYLQSHRAIEANVADNNLTLLTQTQNVADIQFQRLNTTAANIMNAPNIAAYKYVANPYSVGNYFDLYSLIRSLSTYHMNNDYVSSLFLYFPYSGYAVTLNTAYPLRDFHAKYFRVGERDFDAWYRSVVNGAEQGVIFPAERIEFEGVAGDYITYARASSGDIREGSHDVMVFFLLSRAKLNNLLNVNDLETGYFFVTDRDGRVVTSVASSFEVSEDVRLRAAERAGGQEGYFIDGSTMISYVRSAYNGYTYYSFTPLAAITNQTRGLRHTLYAVAALALVTGLALAVVFAYRSAKPIIAMEQVVKDQKELLKSGFLHLLLKGSFGSLNEMRSYIRHIGGRELNGEIFAILVVTLRGAGDIADAGTIETLSLQRIAAREILDVAFEGRAWFHFLDINKIAALVSGSGDADEFRAVLTKEAGLMLERLERMYAADCRVAVGRFSTDALKLQATYADAKSLAERQETDAGAPALLFHSDVAGKRAAYEYSTEQETRLINHIKAGNIEGVADILKNITVHNFVKAKLSPVETQIIYNELLATAYKCLGKRKDAAPLRARLDELLNEGESEFNFIMLYMIFLDICEFSETKTESRGEPSAADVAAELEARFSDPELSLSAIAEKYGMTDTQMSLFFKKETGENFSVFLEKLRMKKAEPLIAANRHAIQDIAQMCGYNSDKSFRRAFKRVYGTSPSALRKADYHHVF